MLVPDTVNQTHDFSKQCPSDNLLIAFDHGNINEDLIEPIGDHLAVCEKCQDVVQSSGPDPLALDMQKNFAEIPNPDDEKVDDRAEALGLQRLLENTKEFLGESSRTPDPLVEQRFNKTKLIGEGQFGSVYLAYDFQLNHPVALKITSEDVTFEDAGARQFLDDVRQMQKFNHSLTPKVYDFGYWKSNRCFSVMEYIAGEKYDKWLRRKRRPVRLAMRFFHQLLGVIEDAHDQDLIHRNLKPSNVFLTREKKIRVTDFGLFPDERYMTVRPEYDPAFFRYNAPEQLKFNSRKAGKKSDIFSLGRILDLIVTTCSNERSVPESETASVDYLRPLNDISAKCCRENLDERFESIAELRQAIINADF